MYIYDSQAGPLTLSQCGNFELMMTVKGHQLPLRTPADGEQHRVAEARVLRPWRPAVPRDAVRQVQGWLHRRLELGSPPLSPFPSEKRLTSHP